MPPFASGPLNYAERAEHCLLFALSLEPADPLADKMFRVARRFQRLAIQEARGARLKIACGVR